MNIADMCRLFSQTVVLPSLLLLSSLLFASCGGSKSSSSGNFYMKRAGLSVADLDKGLAPLEPEFGIDPQENGTIYLSMTVSAGGTTDSPQMKALNSLQSLSFIIFNEDDRLLDSISTKDIVRSGLGGTSTSSLTGSAGVSWRPKGAMPKNIRLVLLMKSDAGLWYKELTAPLNFALSTESIVLNLDYKPSGKGLEFILTAERAKKGSDEEYLPTGEQFRIVLYNGPTLLWSSSKGKMFTQSINPVEPQEIGKKVEYRAMWDGTDSNRAAAKSGALTVVATIPAKPTPYTLRKEIIWPVK